MKIIGIDQSINSTGICVLEDNKKPLYYNIVPKLTRKQSKCAFKRAIFKNYFKDDISVTLKNIAQEIEDILVEESPDLIVMEAVAFLARGRSIIDLSMLNGYLRALYDKLGIPYITEPPTTFKKFACGNGFADKDVMILNWGMMDGEAKKELKGFKIDDLADSYFMASFGKEYLNANPSILNAKLRV